jgi:hypothetical protein
MRGRSGPSSEVWSNIMMPRRSEEKRRLSRFTAQTSACSSSDQNPSSPPGLRTTGAVLRSPAKIS